MLRKTFFAVVLAFIAAPNACAWWPVYKFPAIEGVVIDSATAKPIENVVVGCGYSKEIGVLVDNMSKHISGKVVITNRSGKYSFPGKNVLHLLPSWFPLGGAFQYRLGLCFDHPLYEPECRFGYSAGFHAWDQIGKLLNGTVYSSVMLLTLDEKFASKIQAETDVSKRQVLIREFDGVMNGKLNFLIEVFEGDVPQIKLNWAEIFRKYEGYIAILADVKPKIRHEERLAQLTKAKQLWLEFNRTNENEK